MKPHNQPITLEEALVTSEEALRLKSGTDTAEPTSRSLAMKLAAVMAVIERVPKRGRNQFHGYDYATEADIAGCVRQELAKQAIILIPEIVNEQREAVGEKGEILTTLDMAFTFMDGQTGESVTKRWRGWGTDKGDKGGYKAMTGATKYFLLKTFLVPTGDDPERDNGHSQEPVMPPAPMPDNFANWLLDMELVAENGEQALRKAWADAPLAYRTYVADVGRPAWDAVKKRSILADKKAAAEKRAPSSAVRCNVRTSEEEAP